MALLPLTPIVGNGTAPLQVTPCPVTLSQMSLVSDIVGNGTAPLQVTPCPALSCHSLTCMSLL